MRPIMKINSILNCRSRDFSYLKSFIKILITLYSFLFKSDVSTALVNVNRFLALTDVEKPAFLMVCARGKVLISWKHLIQTMRFIRQNQITNVRHAMPSFFFDNDWC